ncbi:MAG: hypothetical protein H6686_10595 [Fibrobacteria bacterium]|nr:hypothetical protein [Fibrobacteria bacterium]
MNSIALAMVLLSGGWRTDTLTFRDGSRAALVVPNPPGSLDPAQARKWKAPLVVWLHGGIGADDPAKGLRAAVGFAPWADSGGFALLAPSAWPASPWWSASALERVEAQIRIAQKTQGVDSRSLVLAGVSDGGAGALWMAQRLRGVPELHLRAVAVWSANPSVLISRGASFDPVSLGGMPVRWTAGGRDRLYSFPEVAAWWELLRRSGVDLESHYNPGADHDLSQHQEDMGKFPAWRRRFAR